MHLSTKAIREYRIWIDFCEANGWKKSELGALTDIWWKYHDGDGNLITPPAEPDPRDIEIQRLRSEVEQLRGDLNVTRLQRDARICSECPGRRDAERYRWLKTRINWDDVAEQIGECITHYRSWEHRDYRSEPPDSEHIDEYIDSQLAPPSSSGGG